METSRYANCQCDVEAFYGAFRGIFCETFAGFGKLLCKFLGSLEPALRRFERKFKGAL